MLGNVLKDFKINGEITEVKQGPIVTLFELNTCTQELSLQLL